ncbi:hypothetical protein ACFL4T_06040 [candidate division KSB1 bacterium]
MKKFLTFCLIVAVAFILTADISYSQETKTLIGAGTDYGSAWMFELKTNSVKGDAGTLFGVNGGILINKTAVLGLGLNLNVTHDVVNYGYFGLYGNYTFNPDELFHISGHLMIGTGSARAYERPKTSTFDDFWNITGAGFYIIEPGINAEMNFSEKVRIYAGLSYSLVSGLDEDHEKITTSGVTNKDLSGINFNIGVKLVKF